MTAASPRAGATALLVAPLLLAGCGVPGHGPPSDSFTAWPRMELDVASVEAPEGATACPAGWENQGPCREVVLGLRFRNLDPALPILLGDVWTVGTLSGGARAFPVEHPEEDASLGAGAARTFRHAWRIPADATLESVALEHVRLYYDSAGEAPIRVVAVADVPPYT